MRDKNAIYYELLVLRCRQRRQDALEELIRTWDRPLLYYVRRLVDNDEDARQVLQEAWLKAFQGLARLRKPERLPAWLYRIARNTAVSHLRARCQERALFESDDSTRNSSSDDTQLSFDDAERIHHGLSRISLAHREVLTLFFLQDLSLEEIASVLEIPAEWSSPSDGCSIGLFYGRVHAFRVKWPQVIGISNTLCDYGQNGNAAGSHRRRD